MGRRRRSARDRTRRSETGRRAGAARRGRGVGPAGLHPTPLLPDPHPLPTPPHTRSRVWMGLHTHPEVHQRHATTWVAASRSGGRVRDTTRTRLSRPLGPGPVPLIYLSISAIYNLIILNMPYSRRPQGAESSGQKVLPTHSTGESSQRAQAPVYCHWRGARRLRERRDARDRPPCPGRPP